MIKQQILLLRSPRFFLNLTNFDKNTNPTLLCSTTGKTSIYPLHAFRGFISHTQWLTEHGLHRCKGVIQPAHEA